jgi:hypothetical protein
MMFVKSQELPLLVESTESFESFLYFLSFLFCWALFCHALDEAAHHSLHPSVGFTS